MPQRVQSLVLNSRAMHCSQMSKQYVLTLGADLDRSSNDSRYSSGGHMIARIWHGYTSPEHADAYEAMLKPELLPGISKAKGYRGSYLLRRKAGDEDRVHQRS
jgi:hypothetical protein